MNENIDKFISDMRKILQFEKDYGKLQYSEQMNRSKLIISAFENNMIRSSLDLLEICNELPEISYELCRYFDAYILAKGVGGTRGINRVKSLMKRETYKARNM